MWIASVFIFSDVDKFVPTLNTASESEATRPPAINFAIYLPLSGSFSSSLLAFSPCNMSPFESDDSDSSLSSEESLFMRAPRHGAIDLTESSSVPTRNTPAIPKTAEELARDALLSMQWESRRDALTCVREHVRVHHSKSVNLDRGKSSGKRAVIVCSDKSCQFTVKIGKGADGIHRVSSRSDSDISWTHSDACCSSVKLTIVDLVNDNTIVSAVASDRGIAGKALASQAAAKFGAHVPRFLAYRAKAQLASLADGDYVESYNLIEPFLQEFARLNPGSVAEVKTVKGADGGDIFHAAILIPKSICDLIIECGLPLVGVDGTGMKHVKYNGTMVYVVGRTGSLKNVCVSIGFMPIEDAENWSWVLSKLKDSPLGPYMGVDFVLISDRDKGLQNAVPRTFPEVHDFYCFAHVVRNIHAIANRNKWQTRSLGQNNKLAWNCQGAATKREFDEALCALRRVNPDAATYLDNIPHHQWALYRAIELGIRLFGLRTDNFVESENARALRAGIRHMSPLAALREQCIEMAKQLSEERDKLLDQPNMLLPPKVLAIHEQRLKRSFEYEAIRESESTLLVRHHGGLDRSVHRTVDVVERTCTCGRYSQTGLPCEHIMCAARKAGLLATPDKFLAFVESFYSPFYLKSNIVDALKTFTIVVPEVDTLTPSVAPTLPPKFVTTRGRPKKRRIRSAGEGVDAENGSVLALELEVARRGQSNKRQRYACGLCGSKDHNRRTCPQRKE